MEANENKELEKLVDKMMSDLTLESPSIDFTSNDVNFNRTKTPGKLRGFEGGDIIGITKKIESGYFEKLGTNAIWLTPIVEQIHDGVDEGTGLTPHRAPGNAIVFALEGKATIGYEGKDYELKEGECFRFEKNGLHSVTANGKFKMALLLVLE